MYHELETYFTTNISMTMDTAAEVKKATLLKPFIRQNMRATTDRTIGAQYRIVISIFFSYVCDNLFLFSLSVNHNERFVNFILIPGV